MSEEVLKDLRRTLLVSDAIRLFMQRKRDKRDRMESGVDGRFKL